MEASISVVFFPSNVRVQALVVSEHTIMAIGALYMLAALEAFPLD